jgi:hypothetical protein
MRSSLALDGSVNRFAGDVCSSRTGSGVVVGVVDNGGGVAGCSGSASGDGVVGVAAARGVRQL